MSYKVQTTEPFEKKFKKLNKKYPSLKADLKELIVLLEKEAPQIGIFLGDSCYKIRMAITSKGKGKSGGARVIYSVFIKDEQVYLLSIYDKSEQDTISDEELAELVKKIRP